MLFVGGLVMIEQALVVWQMEKFGFDTILIILSCLTSLLSAFPPGIKIKSFFKKNNIIFFFYENFFLLKKKLFLCFGKAI